jgi:hypothetical protein
MWNLGLLGASLFIPVGDYELIETAILGSSAPSVTFNNLDAWSSTYKHLQIRYTARSTRSAELVSVLGLQFNNITAANYFHHHLSGNGSSVSSFAATGSTSLRVGLATGASSTANNFGAGVVDLLDSYSTTKNKTFRSLTGLTNGNFVRLKSGSLAETASVTEIKILDLFGDFVAGSRFSLYGIRG